jgi:hypothetical protein
MFELGLLIYDIVEAIKKWLEKAVDKGLRG